jgi:hypothetical protein
MTVKVWNSMPGGRVMLLLLDEWLLAGGNDGLEQARNGVLSSNDIDPYIHLAGGVGRDRADSHDTPSGYQGLGQLGSYLGNKVAYRAA